MTETTWAGSHTYTAARLHRPQSESELSQLVAGADRVHALGSRHSFNLVADTPGDLVSTADLPRDIEIDSAAAQVRVSGGVRYGDLATELHRQQWALASMASLPHISVAGAVATGTHGSGDGVGSLASAVAAVECVGPDGETRVVTREDAGFGGWVVALGALGVVTHLTLDIEPTYDVRQDLFLHLPWASVEDGLDAITGSAYSVSLFTDWVGGDVAQVWRKSRLDVEGPDLGGTDFLGATAAVEVTHMLDGAPTAAVTQQLGEAGPWHERLPHFRMEFTPSRGEELQSEYLLPREHALEAIGRMRRLGPSFAHLLQISEIRTVARDELWLSSAYGADVVGVHFTWIRDLDGVTGVLPAIEEALLPIGARPHWGKLFTADASSLAAAYPMLSDFQRLRAEVDPTGKFTNAYLDEKLGVVG
jgi:xylitol oxidase